MEHARSDFSDPFHPRETGSVHIGGIVGRKPHQVSLRGGDASSDSYCYPPD